MSPALGAAPLPGFPRVHLSQGAPACHQLLHQPMSLRLPRPDAGAEATVRGFRSALDVSLEHKRQGPVAKPPPFLRGSTDSALTCQGTRAREALCVDFFLTHSRTYFSAAAPFLARPPAQPPNPHPT